MMPGFGAGVIANISAWLDARISAVRGSMLVRGASGWGAIGPGTNGQVPMSNGTDITMQTISSGLTSKVIHATRALNGGSGSASYNGVGFMPTSIKFTCGDAATSCVGFVDSSKNGYSISSDLGALVGAASANVAINMVNQGNGQSATVTSFDSDGFTLAWTGVGSPGAGTIDVIALCEK